MDPYLAYNLLYGAGAAAGLGTLGGGAYGAAKLAGKALSRFRKGRGRTGGKRRSSISRGLVRGISTHKYVRVCSPTWFSTNQSTGFSYLGASSGPSYGVAMGFSLSKLYVQVGTGTAQTANLTYTDLTALYDMYRIDAIEIQIIWTNTSDTTANNTYVAPLVQYANDWDDVVAPTGVNVLTQYSDFKLFQFGTGNGGNRLRLKFRPRINETVSTVSSLGTTGNVIRPSEFINTANPDVMHTGFKMWWDVANQQTNQSDDSFHIYVKYHLTCKLVK